MAEDIKFYIDSQPHLRINDHARVVRSLCARDNKSGIASLLTRLLGACYTKGNSEAKGYQGATVSANKLEVVFQHNIAMNPSGGSTHLSQAQATLSDGTNPSTSAEGQDSIMGDADAPEGSQAEEEIELGIGLMSFGMADKDSEAGSDDEFDVAEWAS